MQILISALVSSAVALLLLFHCWRDKPKQGVFLSAVAWALIILSLWLWSNFAGPEFGLVVGFGLLSMVAWLVVASNAQRKSTKHVDTPRANPKPPPVKTLGWQFSKFLLIFVVAGIAGILSTMGLSRLLPTDEITRLAFVLLVLPVIWGLLAYRIAAAKRLGQPLILTTLVGVAGVGLMFF